jgi:sortase A
MGIFLKKHLPNMILVLIFLIGLCLLLYPTVSDYYNSLHHSKAISLYEDAVDQLSEEELEKMWEAATQYNETLIGRGSSRFEPTAEEQAEYNSLLNEDEIGIMGYIEIPSIDVKLPIYHGIDKNVLQKGVGHLAGSSLPVGGENTHTVLSGHRGLPSAKLFTDLDQMEEGDEFYLHILDQTLAYQVDQIRIVEPEDLSELEICPGKSLCTLLTCTPYGVNSQRLLIRGYQIDYQENQDGEITTEVSLLNSFYVLPVVAVPILLILLIILLVKSRKK